MKVKLKNSPHLGVVVHTVSVIAPWMEDEILAVVDWGDRQSYQVLNELEVIGNNIPWTEYGF